MKRYLLFTVFVSGMTTLAGIQRRIVAYLGSFPLSWDLRQARLASHKGMISLRQSQSATGEELGALLPSVLDRAFKGEL